MAAVAGAAAGRAGTVVLKIAQHLPSEQDLDVDLQRHRLPAPLEFADVDGLLREAYGAGWVPTYLGSDGAPHAFTEAAFPDFLAQARQVPRLLLHREEGHRDEGLVEVRASPPGDSAGLKWQVLVYTGWVDYGEPQLSQLRAAHSAGERLVVLRYEIKGEEHVYEVDLQELEQRNLRTRTVRSVRTRPAEPDADSRACPEGEAAVQAAMALRSDIGSLCALFLPLLKEGTPRAVVLECRSSGTALRVRLGGSLDVWGCTGLRASFVVQAAAGDFGGHLVLTLRSVVNGGFLRRTAAAPLRLECASGEQDEDCLFEVVSYHRALSATRRLAAAGASTYGVALRLLTTGQYLDVSEAGDAILADSVPEGEEQPGELFILRYQPNYDEAWKTDGQFGGRRRWAFAKDPNFYTFEEFVAFVNKEGFKCKPFGESGLVAAKLLWASSVQEGAGLEEERAVLCLAKALSQKRLFSASGPNKTLYSFTEMLAFVEARKLRVKGKTDVETALFRWLQPPPRTPPLAPEPAASLLEPALDFELL